MIWPVFTSMRNVPGVTSRTCAYPTSRVSPACRFLCCIVDGGNWRADLGSGGRVLDVGTFPWTSLQRPVSAGDVDIKVSPSSVLWSGNLGGVVAGHGVLLAPYERRHHHRFIGIDRRSSSDGIVHVLSLSSPAGTCPGRQSIGLVGAISRTAAGMFGEFGPLMELELAHCHDFP